MLVSLTYVNPENPAVVTHNWILSSNLNLVLCHSNTWPETACFILVLLQDSFYRNLSPQEKEQAEQRTTTLTIQMPLTFP
jgi:hypothetical protein